eukprot:2147329-Lingulodinium_polyedra.AAC.1
MSAPQVSDAQGLKKVRPVSHRTRKSGGQVWQAADARRVEARAGADSVCRMARYQDIHERG